MSIRAWFRVAVIGLPLTVIGLIIFAPAIAGVLYAILRALAPVWLLPLLLITAWSLWVMFIRLYYVSTIPYVTLELKPGDNTPKTAKPMELIFFSIYYRTELTVANAFLKGSVRLPWSFEVLATGGTVRFFIHIPVRHRAVVEGRIRAEYHDIDIDETRDYTRESNFNPFDERLTMREYTLGKNDSYPLKTYVRHEHEKVRRDVFSEFLDELASVGEGQEVWVSLIVRPHQRDWGRGPFSFLSTPVDTLHQDAQAVIAGIIGPLGDVHVLSQEKRDIIKSIEDALKKPSFNCGLRVLYRANKKQWSNELDASLDHVFDRFGDAPLNSFEVYNPREHILWPLTDLLTVVPALEMKYCLILYRTRTFFLSSYYGRPFILNTEELATLWHMPKFGRTNAHAASDVRLAPPENLPT